MASSRKPASLPYREGDWFAVPLRSGGYGLGVVARMDGEGIVLGYFFGPKRDQVPSFKETVRLKAGNAAYVRRFGDLGLLHGKWPIVGRSDLWRKELWPIPRFCRYSPDLNTRAYDVEYSEDKLEAINEVEISPEECLQMPRDGLSGFGAIEITLGRLLSGEDQTS